MKAVKSDYKAGFYRRALLCFILCIVMFFISVMRVASVATADYSSVKSTQNGIRLTIGRSRGTIYDRNRVPLTNNSETIIAAVSPTPRAITAISKILSGQELESVLERLKGNKPVLCQVPEMIECDGIICTKIYSSDVIPALHLLGYTDKDGQGVSGIEAAYNDILYSEDDISVYYDTDAKGRILEGIDPVLTDPKNIYSNGVVTTLDINIQNIAEKHAQSIVKGAVVICDAKTGEIRASVSRPDFDPYNISDYLDKPDSPLLNRAISAYSVGSVFKPCVAAAGIESGKSGFTYTCTGSCEIVDRFFKCHKLDGHGKMNLESALAFSCNTFFYNFAFDIGGENIYDTAKKLNFGQSFKLCDGITTAEGSLPSLESLSNIAYLANFSIGQGELLLSPVSILTLYCSIASDGKYYLPTVVDGVIENGNFREYERSAPTKVMEPQTAATLRTYLQSVLTEGTGAAAKPKNVTAAGKTATAQTGKFENGVEICHGWFCGFFPAENPEYVAVVFCEGDSRQTVSCGEIFAGIADDIYALDSSGN